MHDTNMLIHGNYIVVVGFLIIFLMPVAISTCLKQRVQSDGLVRWCLPVYPLTMYVYTGFAFCLLSKSHEVLLLSRSAQ